jgi:hypothetical protein
MSTHLLSGVNLAIELVLILHELEAAQKPKKKFAMKLSLFLLLLPLTSSYQFNVGDKKRCKYIRRESI